MTKTCVEEAIAGEAISFLLPSPRMHRNPGRREGGRGDVRGVIKGEPELAPSHLPLVPIPRREKAAATAPFQELSSSWGHKDK